MYENTQSCDATYWRNTRTQFRKLTNESTMGPENHAQRMRRRPERGLTGHKVAAISCMKAPIR